MSFVEWEYYNSEVRTFSRLPSRKVNMNVSWLDERHCGQCGEPIVVVCIIEKSGPTMHYYTPTEIEVYACPKCKTPLAYEELA